MAVLEGMAIGFLGEDAGEVLHSIGSLLWGEVSSACGRTRYFSTRESTQRVPGAAKGCMSHGRPRTPRC